jgi:hypothetical protein
MSQAQAFSCANDIVETPEKSVQLAWQGMKYESIWTGCNEKVGPVHYVDLDWGGLTQEDIDFAYSRIDGCSVPEDSMILGFKKEFKAACNLHDVCYSTLGKSQHSCDKSLRKNAEQICDELDQDSECYIAAEIMAAGARGANDLGINDGYKKGQEWAKKWKNKKYFSLRDHRSKKCMGIEYPHANNDTNILLWDCNGGSGQKWFYEDETGFFRSQVNPEKCLANGGQTQAGGNIVIFDCHNSDNVRFDIERDNDNYSINLIISTRQNNRIVIDAYGRNNGANIGQWHKNGGKNQLWEVLYDEPLYEGLVYWKEYRFKSDNYRGHFFRHRNSEIWLDKSENSELFKKDSTFIVVPGLSGSGISFQSKNYPEYFIRHSNSKCYIHKYDGSDLFNEDASWYPKKGLANNQGYSFESVNHPGYYMRHSYNRVRIDRIDGSQLFKQDATWLAN